MPRKVEIQQKQPDPVDRTSVKYVQPNDLVEPIVEVDGAVFMGEPMPMKDVPREGDEITIRR